MYSVCTVPSPSVSASPPRSSAAGGGTAFILTSAGLGGAIPGANEPGSDACACVTLDDAISGDAGRGRSQGGGSWLCLVREGSGGELERRSSSELGDELWEIRRFFCEGGKNFC